MKKNKKKYIYIYNFSFFWKIFQNLKNCILSFFCWIFLIFSKFSKIKRLKQSKKTQFWKYSKIKQVFNFVKIWHILNLLVLKNIQNPKQYFCTCLILGTIVGRRQLCLQSEGFKPILSYQRLVPSIERLVPSIQRPAPDKLKEAWPWHHGHRSNL